MKRSPILVATLVLVLFGWSCSSEVSKDESGDKLSIEIKTDTDEIKKDLKNGMEDLEEGLKDMTAGIAEMVDGIKIEIDTDGEPVNAVDFRDLKALLPDRLLRIDRTSVSGERSGIKGLQVAVAEAEYEGDDRYLKVAIVDGGGLPLGAITNAGWSMVEVDKEDRNGFERTTTIEGHKAFEKYNSKWEEGELVILYQERFIVTLKGKGIEAGDLRGALDDLNLKKLEKM